MASVLPGQENVKQNHTFKTFGKNFTRHGGLSVFR